jgi:hypothetical protein
VTSDADQSSDRVATGLLSKSEAKLLPTKRKIAASTTIKNGMAKTNLKYCFTKIRLRDVDKGTASAQRNGIKLKWTS